MDQSLEERFKSLDDKIYKMKQDISATRLLMDQYVKADWMEPKISEIGERIVDLRIKVEKLIDKKPNQNKWVNILSAGTPWVLLIAILGFMGRQMVINERGAIERQEKLIERLTDMDKRITSIESNRFTSNDGLNLMENLLDKLPPDWLLKRVEKNEENIKDLMSNNRRHKR